MRAAMKSLQFQNVVLALLLTIAVGWLLVVGRAILLPIVTATLIVYLMLAATEGLARLPLLKLLPETVLRFLVLVGFSLAFVFLSFLIGATVREIAAVSPTYEANLDQLLARIAQQFSLDKQEIWNEIRAMTIERIDISRIFLSLLGGFTQVGTTVFVVVLYAAFIMAERHALQRKILSISNDPERARRTIQMLEDINRRISDYLTVKTVINIVLGALSWIVLWALGVDFALFWAVMIGLLNYIPYIGSYIGVAFPVVLSVAQFGSLSLSIVLAALLVTAQVIMGNVVEPRLIGRQLNLSPLVVLISLSLWSAFWGIPGAILAIPLTAILSIVLASFPQTRFLAMLLAERVESRPRAGGE